MFAVSVCQSVCHSAYIGGGACSVRRVPCVRGHSVQPLSNYFDHLFVFLLHVFVNLMWLSVNQLSEKTCL